MKALYFNSSIEGKKPTDTWTEPRLFDRYYTIPVIRPGGVNYTASTPIFFNIQTVFKGITVKCISVHSNTVPLFGTGDAYFLTLKNTRGQELLYDHPIVNLWDGFNPAGGGSYVAGYGKQLRLFSLTDIDFRNSYYRTNFSAPVLTAFEVFRITLFW